MPAGLSSNPLIGPSISSPPLRKTPQAAGQVRPGLSDPGQTAGLMAAGLFSEAVLKMGAFGTPKLVKAKRRSAPLA